MCDGGRGKKRFKKKKGDDDDDGFGQWGGYKAAKRAKLLEQFHNEKIEKISDIFAGVKIMVNGLTHPCAPELKNLMAAHGGEFHMYQVSSTTHIIASNLPNVKIKHLGAVPIVKPAWIVESIALNKLLDYKRYLLYTHQTKTQPALNFPVISKPIPSSSSVYNKSPEGSPKEDKESKENEPIEDEDLFKAVEWEEVPKPNTQDEQLENSSDEIFSDSSWNNENLGDNQIFKSEINFSRLGSVAETSGKITTGISSCNTENAKINYAIAGPSCRIDTTTTSFNNEHKSDEKSLKNSAVAGTTSRMAKTASDPKFLEEFYNNSRLHLISTLGAEFKQLVGQLREKSNGIFPGRAKLISLNEVKVKDPSRIPSSVIMHIDMDCFFVSVGLRKHPELRGKPVAITHAKNGIINTNDPDRQATRAKEFELYQQRLPEGVTSRVADIKDKIDGLASLSEIASCSYEARRYGIKNGMFLGQAIKLCPELKTLPYDFEGYKEVSNTLYNTVASYTLDIEAVSCDEMYVDVRKVLLDTGLSVEEWAKHIRNEIMSVTGCPCSTGFGANRLQARLATRKAKPAGQFYLKPEDVQDYMSEIPLADLPGVGRATLVKLQNLGLNTCGDVQIASLKILQSELGTKQGERIWDQSFGRDNKPLDFNHERKSVSAEINYGIRFKTKEECYNFLKSLADEVFNRLSDINMKARGMTLKLLVRAQGAPVETAKFLGHGVCDAISKSNSSNVIFTNSDIIYREAKSIYDKLGVHFAELRGVGIQLTKLEKNAPINKALSKFLNQASWNKSNSETHKNSIETVQTHQENKTFHPTSLNITKKSKSSGTDISSYETLRTFKALSINVTKVSDNSTEKINTSKNSNDSALKPRGRGRPKGSKNSGVSKGLASKGKEKINNAKMDSFVVKSKRTIADEIPDEASVPNLELAKLRKQIDMSVLNELPESIRKEIMKEYQLETVPKTNDVKPTTSKSNKEKRSICNVNKCESAESVSIKKSPFSSLSWKEIKPIIKSWISSEVEPSEDDVEMLADHLRQLAVDRKIEVLQSGFNFLHRRFSELNCSWHRAYFVLVNAVQQGMVARYGKTLLVKIDFICCRIQ